METKDWGEHSRLSHSDLPSIRSVVKELFCRQLDIMWPWISAVAGKWLLSTTLDLQPFPLTFILTNEMLIKVIMSHFQDNDLETCCAFHTLLYLPITWRSRWLRGGWGPRWENLRAPSHPTLAEDRRTRLICNSEVNLTVFNPCNLFWC